MIKRTKKMKKPLPMLFIAVAVLMMLIWNMPMGSMSVNGSKARG